MKKILLFLFFSLSTLSTFATAQATDLLIWKGEQYRMATLPLMENQELVSLFYKEYHVKGNCTAYYRGYIGYWSIKDEELYLDSIFYVYQGEEDRMMIPSKEKLFSKYLTEKGVKASWMNGELRLMRGKWLIAASFTSDGYYEHEAFLTMENGKVVKTELAEQRKIYSPKKSLKEMNAYFKKLYPKAKGTLSVKVCCTKYSEDGYPEDIEFIYFDNEGTGIHHEKTLKKRIRKYILENKMIPTYYIRGEYTSRYVDFWITFTDWRTKYVRRGKSL